MATKYRIESVRYSNVDMDEIYDGERIVATVADGRGWGMVAVIEQETAPLHAEIERLKAENAKLRKFVQDVSDLEAVIAARTVISDENGESFWDGLNQVNEVKAFMYDNWKEDAQELLDELEESEGE